MQKTVVITASIGHAIDVPRLHEFELQAFLLVEPVSDYDIVHLQSRDELD